MSAKFPRGGGAGPFLARSLMLVELDPLSSKEGNSRAQSTDMHTLKPRHNLVISFLKQIKTYMTITTTFRSNSLQS